MSELRDFVYKDVRVDEGFDYLKKIPAEPDARKKIDIFHAKPGSIPDAERLAPAFVTYEKYPFFKTLEKQKCYGYNYFFVYGGVRITADLLTGPSRILKLADKLAAKLADEAPSPDPSRIEELNESLDAFCKVVYTPGNCCPVMNNPHSSRNPEIRKDHDWEDTCYWKLKHCLDLDREYDGIQDAGWEVKLGDRDCENMFAVYPAKTTGSAIRDKLMLNDYYNGDELIVKPIPTQVRGEDLDDYAVRFIEYLKLYTSLIIRRGIRIFYCGNLPEDADITALEVHVQKLAHP